MLFRQKHNVIRDLKKDFNFKRERPVGPHRHRPPNEIDPRYIRTTALVWSEIFKVYLGSMCTHWLETPQPLPTPRILAHIRGRYWSAKIDNISLWSPQLEPISKIEILKCRVPVSNTLRNIFVLPFTGQLFYGDHLLRGEGKVFGGERESVDMKDRPLLEEY